jgi:class 3 adenylate cyclase/tetratricopeptide (TPR) repeat protein
LTTVATTQTVTVLFTDLVGSTELASHLGPAAADALRQTHFGLLRGAVQAAGGTEVKSLGDGLMVAFTSLSRALACAVAMQQAIERHNRRDDRAPLSVRIGVSTGEATEDDGDYFGDPVIEASRLCATAEGGQILATEVVKVMAGRHATQAFVSVGDLDLKGLPEPVPSVEVVWEPAQAADVAGGQLPLPAQLVGASAESLFAFFGRADELTRLADTRKTSAVENRLRVTFISGEPGIGKTTLVAQAARSAHGAGANVLYGHCEEGLGVPYQPWIGALSQLIDQSDEGLLREFVETKGLSLARLLPDLARRLSMDPPSAGTDADTERFLILEGVARLLALASSRAPLVVALDDLHWVDAASLQLLRHLVASAIPMSVVVVGTFRESDLSRSHPLTGALADLRREPCVDRLDLLGLEDVEIIELLEAAAGHEVEDEGVALAHALRRETGGNPFFLVEVIRHLADTGAFVQDDEGRWGLSTGLDALSLPTSVREVVAHRVARLGEETEQALSLASVIGRDFELEILAELLGADQDRLLDLLDGAMTAGLITESEGYVDRYRFVHALIQHALYQDLSASRRQRAHQRVAEALESTSTDNDQQVAELARHWMAATRPSDVTKALYYARRAADVALASYAPLDAISWYSKALELLARQTPGDDRERCALMVGLGTAQREAGQPEFRQTMLDAAALARGLGDTELLVAAALGAARGLLRLSEADTEQIEVLQAALTSLGDTDDSDRARLLVALAEVTDARDWKRRRDLATEAVALARDLHDETTVLDVTTRSYGFRAQPDSSAERLVETEKAVALADRLGDPSARFAAYYTRIHACMEVGDLEGATSALDQLTALVDQTGLPVWESTVLVCRAGRLVLSGDFIGAEAVNEQALEIGTRALEPSGALAAYGGLLYQIRLQQGRLDEIADIFTQAVAANPAIAAFRSVVIDMYCTLGRLDEARALFEPDAANGFVEMPRDPIWTTAMSYFADSAVNLRHHQAAQLLYDELRPYADLVIYPLGPVLGALGRPVGRLAHLLGHHRDAESLFQSALSTNERLRAPYWIALTKLEYADLLAERAETGDKEKARELAREALVAAQEHGYRALEPRAKAVLESVG